MTMSRLSRENALDHVVVVMFENRSFDNLLGRLYEPGEVTSFEGVIGKDLSNPVPGGLSTGLRTGSSATESRRTRTHPTRTRARSGRTSTRSCSGSSTRR